MPLRKGLVDLLLVAKYPFVLLSGELSGLCDALCGYDFDGDPSRDVA